MFIPDLDFAVVGAPKCGTTWFCEGLGRHPDVRFLEHKDAGPLAVDILAELADDDTYRAWFERASAARRVGEAAVSYLYSDAALDALASLDPQPVIFILVRDPLEQVPSLHGQLRAVGAQPIASFDEAWAASAGAPSPLLDYRYVGRAADRVRLWDEAFGDRVQLILFDDLRSRPAAVIRTALDALGVEPLVDVPDTDDPRRNRHTEPRSYALARWLRNPPPPVRRLARTLLTERGRATVVNAANRWNDRVADRRPSSDATLREMADEFSDSIAWLRTRSGRDLSDWGGAALE